MQISVEENYLLLAKVTLSNVISLKVKGIEDEQSEGLELMPRFNVF